MRKILASLAISLLGLTASAQQAPPGRIIEVEIRNPLERGHQQVFSGRLIVRLATEKPSGMSLAPAKASESPQQQEARRRTEQNLESVNFVSAARKPFEGLTAFAVDVSNVHPGDVIRLDANAVAMSTRLSDLPAGDYYAHAVLDQGNDFALGGGNDDLISNVERIHLGDGPARIALVSQAAPKSDWPPMNPQLQAVRLVSRDFSFVSPMLSAFYGKPTAIRGYAVVPSDYQGGSNAYPVVFNFGPYGETFDKLPVFELLPFQSGMSGNTLPPMLYVVLDQFGPNGAHNFVGGALHGPWDKAFAEEFIPWFEKEFRADGKPSSRFLTGNGSGGYTALWLLSRNPKLYAGAWAQSPDPVDFRSFFSTDIYAANANLFTDSGGAPKTMIREDKNNERRTYSTRAVSELETVYGPNGRLDAFERAFSPVDASGKPRKLFNRSTGAIDPAVAKSWGDTYDLSRYLSAHWPTLKPDLDGKIHIIAGGEDDQFRNLSVEKFKQTLDTLGARYEIETPRGRSDQNLFALTSRWPAERYAIARPGAGWAPRPSGPPARQ